MMDSLICEYKKCTGCAACFSICPKNCITMHADDEGFLRPKIDDSMCINCNRCKKVCPINKKSMEDNKFPTAFAVKHKNDSVREKSSSGGVFTAVSEIILKSSGVVIGAGFDENFMVKHKICNNVESLDELRRSKYVQSRIGTVLQDTKKYLDKGINVLFVGTPCQVDGLLSYLGKTYTNLYTIDFICHGVPSPMAWKKYMEFRRKSANAEITDISFRSKELGWKNYSMKIDFSNGNKYSSTVSEDMYLRSFIMDMDLRPLCYDCHFKTIHHLSDFTVADYWGADKQIPEWNDNKGISLVLAHSEKAINLLAECNSVDVLEVPFERAIEGNPSLTTSVKQPNLRKKFMREIQIKSFDKLHDKYCGNNILAKVRRKMPR